MPSVVILGGAYAGVEAAHRLLKNTKSTFKDLKVILVSKNSHFYWNIASVRAVVPGQLKESEYCLPIADGFKQYAANDFEFIVGSAEQVDIDNKTVQVSSNGAEKTLNYDHLILATGSRAVGDMPWKASGSHEEVQAKLAEIQAKVQSASHIVVAGAGATGVETAGELAFEYKDKSVVLLSSDDEVLGGDSVAGNALSELKKLGVEVKAGVRVKSTDTTGEGKTEITLNNGETITTDLYLPTFGLIPNTEYLPSSLLNEKKGVKVDDCLRVVGAKDVWAAGDILAGPISSFFLASMQAQTVCKNIDLAFKEKDAGAFKGMPFAAVMCSVGRSRGIGRLGYVKLFSFMVYQIKVKTLGIQKLPGWVDGSSF